MSAISKAARRLWWIILLQLIALSVVSYLTVDYDVRTAKSSRADYFTAETIDRVLASETRVLYRMQEGEPEVELGLLFQGQHRRYVEYEQIPQACIDALVSAEDKNYWEHDGWDPEGIAMAIYRDVQLRSFRYGGSTLTQQLVKNLVNRSGRGSDTPISRFFQQLHPGLSGKYLETMDAIVLDERFSKKQILGWYFNQFHVQGEGVGLDVAARYYFGKSVNELGTIECAFIAGSVKGPSNYNPFRGDEAGRARRRANAEERKGYVLNRMVVEGKLDRGQADDLIVAPIPFAEEPGVIGTDSNVLLEAVADALESDPIRSILLAAGVENPSTAGLTIITNIDQDVQTVAQTALTSHLEQMESDLRELPESQRQQALPLQGSVLVLDPQGRIEAMVGGRDNRNLNRVFSNVQPGSIMKSYVYFVAQTLGWSPDDLIANQVQGFYLTDYGVKVKWYWPAKAHESGGAVDMAEALGRSENIAAIYTWENLSLWLTPRQMHRLASHMEMVPAEGESLTQWKKRVQDEFKITPHLNGQTVYEFAFRQAKHRKAAQLLAEGNVEEAQRLVQLAYGGEIYDAALAGRSGNEAQALFLTQTFLALEQKMLNPAVEEFDPEASATSVPDAVEQVEAPAEQIVAGMDDAPLPDDSSATDNGDARARILEQLRAQLETEKVTIVGESGLTVATLKALRMEMDSSLRQAFPDGVESLDPYEIDRLVLDQEFRRAVSWRYAVALAEEMGVETELDMVHPFPLGANAISPLEVARLYQAMITGRVDPLTEGVEQSLGRYALGPALINEIRDATGQVIWKVEPPQSRQLFGNDLVEVAASLLRAPFGHAQGTARSQSAAVVINGMVLPLAGKTGTTNQGRSLSFCGYIPETVATSGGRQAALLEGARILHTNIRYNIDLPIQRKSGRYYSSGEALQVWSQVAPAVAQSVIDLSSDDQRTVGGKATGGIMPLILPGGVILRNEASTTQEGAADTQRRFILLTQKPAAQ